MTEQNNVSLNPKAPEQGERLHRGLSNRHIQLIAIGGAIGTGLFMGSGRAISLAGPSVIFVYMLMAPSSSWCCELWARFCSPT